MNTSIILPLAKKYYSETTTSFIGLIEDISKELNRDLTGEELSEVVNWGFFKVENNFNRLSA